MCSERPIKIDNSNFNTLSIIFCYLTPFLPIGCVSYLILIHTMVQVYVFSFLFFFLTVLWRQLPPRKMFNTCCKGNLVVFRAMESLIRCSSWIQSSSKFSPRFLPSQFNTSKKASTYSRNYSALLRLQTPGDEKPRWVHVKDATSSVFKVRMPWSIWRNNDDEFVPDVELVTNTGCNAWRILVDRYVTLWSCLSIIFRNLTIQPSKAEMLPIRCSSFPWCRHPGYIHLEGTIRIHLLYSLFHASSLN